MSFHHLITVISSFNDRDEVRTLRTQVECLLTAQNGSKSSGDNDDNDGDCDNNGDDGDGGLIALGSHGGNTDGTRRNGMIISYAHSLCNIHSRRLEKYY